MSRRNDRVKIGSLDKNQAAIRRAEAMARTAQARADEAFAREFPSPPEPVGWVPIGDGEESGTSFSVDATADGKYPAGTFSKLRLTMEGRMSATGTLRARINGVTTSGLYRAGLLQHDATGSLFNDDWGNFSGWPLALWGTVDGAHCVLELLRTGEEGRVPFRAHGGRAHGTAAASIKSEAWGQLTADQDPVASIQIDTSGTSATFDPLRWELEGYRPP